MWPIFTNPWALLGLISVPALIGIYWLRNRHQRYPVSSLLLWADVRELKSGGPRVERFQAPVLFFLELLILILLVLAAAKPFWPTPTRVRPIFIVLDDSFSMRAGKGDSTPRAQAIAALRQELAKRGSYEANFVLAGAAPQKLSVKARSWSEVEKALEQWRCLSPTAALEAGHAEALNVGKEVALILVITDQPPPMPLKRGQLKWWAFGEPQNNVAITRAVRDSRAEGDRCLLEVSNFSNQPVATHLLIDVGAQKRIPLKLSAHEQKRIPPFTLPPGTGPLRARLESEDALALDSQVSLLSNRREPLRVELRLPATELRKELKKVIEARGDIQITATNPELVFTDQMESPEVPEGTWVMHLISEKEPVGYRGPFDLDHRHELADGLSLQSVIWAAGKSKELPGRPVILTPGNVPLLSDRSRPDGSQELYLRLTPEYSRLGDNWVILMVNLLNWRESRRAGLSRVNLNLGEHAELTLTTPVNEVVLATPSGTKSRIPVIHRRAVLPGEQLGIHEVLEGEKKSTYAVNAVQPVESDLTKAASGLSGDWVDRTTLRLEYRNVQWLLVLIALALLILHLYLSYRQSRS